MPIFVDVVLVPVYKWNATANAPTEITVYCSRIKASLACIGYHRTMMRVTLFYGYKDSNKLSLMELNSQHSKNMP